MPTNNPRPALSGDPALDNFKLVTDSCRNVDLPLAAFDLNHMVSLFSLGRLKKRRLVVFHLLVRYIARWLFIHIFSAFLFYHSRLLVIAHGIVCFFRH